MALSAAYRAEIARWGKLGRWERSELGRSLRRLGLSYGEIMELIPVPKGTLAGWCRDVVLTPQQVAGIRQRRGPRAGPRDTQWKRRLKVERIQAEARSQVNELVNDPFWVAGVVLYWGEGSKTKRSLALSNTDPRALRLFIGWCRRYHDPSGEFVLSLHLHAGNDDRAAKSHWAAELGISEFHRTYVKPAGTGQRTNRLLHGVCRAYMRRSTDAWLKTEVWIQELARTLDC